MLVRSSKRSYHIHLSESVRSRVIRNLKLFNKRDLQEFIDVNFSRASALSKSPRSGAWKESRMYRDKAKLGILIMDDYHPTGYSVEDRLGWLYV